MNDVLVYTPDYERHFSRMADNELMHVFNAWREYYKSNKARYTYIQVRLTNVHRTLARKHAHKLCRSSRTGL